MRGRRRRRRKEAGKASDDGANAPERRRQEPTFEMSGLLRREANANERGKFIDHDEPADAVVAGDTLRLRMYVFKGDEEVEAPLLLNAKTRYVFGRDREAVDVATDHPSCSKQHAVVQFRRERDEEKYGKTRWRVTCWLLDLNSTNRTKLNGKWIEPQWYYELSSKDCVQFGSSTRTYVFIDEKESEK